MSSGTTDIKVNKWNYSISVTRSECLRLPLKSGGYLSLAWNRLASLDFHETQFNDGWKPAGTGSVFSFLPLVNTYGAFRRKLSNEGVVSYDHLGGVGVEIPITANVGATYFTEYYHQDGVYYEYYAGYGIDVSEPLFGRPNRRYDVKGNELKYHYTNNQGGSSPLLRVITGDIAGDIVPYFGYADESLAVSSAPITKVFILDKSDASKSRTVYFDYTYYDYLPYLTKVTNPGGCVRQFDPLLPAPQIGDYQILREVDAEGYEAYFEYSPWAGVLAKTVESEGRVVYYEYPDYLTRMIALGLKFPPFSGQVVKLGF